MRHDGSRLPPSWGLWLALLLWGLLLLYLLVPILPAHGQTQSERLASIERELIYSLGTCEKLSNELNAQKAKVGSLQADLTALRESLGISAQKLSDLESELESSKQLSTDLQGEISRLKDLLASSSERLAALSQTFDSYRKAKETEARILERKVTAWKVATIVAAALAIAGGVWAAVK